MAFIDYYKTLGIDKSASEKEVKNAYRKMARKFHPDLNPNDASAKANFQQINEANAVLSDATKRAKYDQHGKDWEHAQEYEKARQQQANSRGQRSSGRQQNESEFSDFFEAMFGGSMGGSQGRQAKYRGEDFTTSLYLELLEAYTTHKQELNINGRKIRITIPAGIENGQTIKIAGHGGQGKNGGPAGDLYITFTIANHPRFKRMENNLYTAVDLDIYTAILGGEILLDTLNGQVKLKVAPETQSGTKIKLRGKGFPVYKHEGQFGDLHITYSIQIPTNLSEKQKELFLELKKLSDKTT
ncbi:MAG: J domain-containing protein [Bacteroidales bacterium]|nr:J domain-containing protein [Bacteroidales bacterium]